MGLSLEMRGWRRFRPLLVAGGFALICVNSPFVLGISARAGSTRPELGLGQVSAIAVGGGGALLEVTGQWDFDDILQIDFPARLVVSRGSTFISIPIGGTAEASSGTFAGLADGLQGSEIAQLEAAAQPDPAAALLRLEPHRMVAALPASVGNGPLHVVVYLAFPAEGFFLSNALTTTLEGVAGGNP